MKIKVITLALTLFGLAGTAAAEDVSCPPDLGAVTVDGNVLVTRPCTLDGTTVKGNVHLYSGGSLIARNARATTPRRQAAATRSPETRKTSAPVCRPRAVRAVQSRPAAALPAASRRLLAGRALSRCWV